ncbi:MAG: hypothetical protein Q9227_000706 [Pyrenula ochraceoflavens]
MRVTQLLAGFAAIVSLASAAPTDSSRSQLAKRVKKFQWFGVNESGAEFGQTSIPGTYNKDYTFPSTSSIDTLMGKGLNIFRIPILMERIARGSMTSSLDATYLSQLTAVVNHITNAGGYAIVDPHNFGRYNGAIITSTANFQTFWKNVATAFKSNSKVIFDTNNEYHDMDESLVVSLNQAAINGIRSAGATSQYIFVEGNSYTGAWTWTTQNTAMASLTDPNNKIIYEMHQYLDSDGSGTSDQCVSSTIGSQRITDATTWLKNNGKKGILGEFAGGSNSVCESAVTGMVNYMAANTDVWTGGLWWGGGPWWGDYIFSMEPPSGTAYVNVLPSILPLI